MRRRRHVSSSELTATLLEKELKRERYRQKYRRTLSKTILTLATIALLVIVGVLVFPVLTITGDSMGETLRQGQLVVALRGAEIKCGDIAAFQYGANKILIKRVIAGPGDEVMFEEDGTVLINGEKLQEPYVKNKGGECDLEETPYVVPEGRYFVMGDNRALSLDSRNEQFGCIAQEQIIGPVVLRIWPFEQAGLL